jgi:hypothetical protein
MIYVDQLIEYHKRNKFGYKWCHLWTDGDIEELHAFAAEMGLKKCWYQNHRRHNRPSFPHYDLNPYMRTIALRKGAKEIALKSWLQIVHLSSG